MDIISIWQYIQLGNTWLVDVGWIEIFAVFFTSEMVLWMLSCESAELSRRQRRRVFKNIALSNRNNKKATEITHM
jgi:hypothetical protein